MSQSDINMYTCHSDMLLELTVGLIRDQTLQNCNSSTVDISFSKTVVISPSKDHKKKKKKKNVPKMVFGIIIIRLLAF